MAGVMLVCGAAAALTQADDRDAVSGGKRNDAADSARAVGAVALQLRRHESLDDRRVDRLAARDRGPPRRRA